MYAFISFRVSSTSQLDNQALASVHNIAAIVFNRRPVYKVENNSCEALHQLNSATMGRAPSKDRSCVICSYYVRSPLLFLDFYFSHSNGLMRLTRLEGFYNLQICLLTKSCRKSIKYGYTFSSLEYDQMLYI